MTARNGRKMPNWVIGAIAFAFVVFGFYMGFVKSLPFSGHGYQLKAVFADAQNIRANSPVRVSGVNVGKVTEVTHAFDESGRGIDAAVVTMELTDDARPVHDDAYLKLRPRLFLEGNLFVDLRPGTPAGEELESGALIPMDQTAISVQFDQVLSTLQKPVRSDLQTFLKEFGAGLDTYGGAEGFRELFRASPAAYRSTAQVNEALLGTEPGDLQGLIRNFDEVIKALDRNEVQLQDFITNLRVVTGSFAAESNSLKQAITELPAALRAGRPALAKLNASFPALRAFSREALPGTRAANKALDDANPFIRQLRGLVSKPELRGLVADLRPTIPRLASLSKTTIPFFEQARLLSSCFNNVIIPWSLDTVSPDPIGGEPAVGPVYKETAYGLVGIAGESRSGDGNGQYIRVVGGGGVNTVTPFGLGTGSIIDLGNVPGLGQTAGFNSSTLLGSEPAIESSAKTPFRPDVPCETQDPPNLDAGGAGPAPPQTPASARSATPATRAATLEYANILRQQEQASKLQASGDKAALKTFVAEMNRDIRHYNKVTLPAYQSQYKGY